MKPRMAMLMTLIASFVIGNAPTFAQFDKYKSKTKLNPTNPSQNQAASSELPASIDMDLFGRGTGVAGAKKAKADSKYVNLNPETAFGPEVIESFDFPNATLLDLTKHMQKLTGINIIFDKEIKGKVSIMAPTPLTVGDAWKAYLAALHMNNYTLVKNGAFYQVISSRDVRYTPTKIYSGTYTPDTNNYVMRIIPLKNIDGTEITRSFRPFMSRYGRIIDIEQTNTIIIQDTGSNINRMVKLIKFLDVPGFEESLQIIPVKHSSAQEIAKLLDTILKGQTSSTRRSSSKNKKANSISKIIAEPRTNTIIAMANADGAKKLVELVKKLDVPVAASGGGKIHVYYLNHGDAETLAKTLSTLVSNQPQPTTRTTTRRTSRFRTSTSNQETLFNAQVKITADKENNALVVTASPTDYLTIKQVIAKLDIPRDQVFVEGLILETNVSNGSQFSVSVLGAYGSGNAQRGGFVPDNNIFNLLGNQFTNISGLFAGGGLGSKVDLDLGTGTSITVNTINGLIRAIATDNRTNVLATPQILALDNQEAEFEVGETVPIAIRNDTPQGSTTSIQQQNVSLNLKITPQINRVSRMVKLKINQKIDEFSERDVSTAGGGVATTTRSAVTTVVVRDRDTIAMGGLMRDRVVHQKTKVPLLGDIPVLGWLFRSQAKSMTKVNLLFFLTPRILSPYGKMAAQTVKDSLNRRSAHLKDVIGSDDPNKSTVKGLFEKALKQEKGPLFDPNDNIYKDNNKFTGSQTIDGSFSPVDKQLETTSDSPDYQDIATEAEQPLERVATPATTAPQGQERILPKDPVLDRLNSKGTEVQAQK